MAKANPRTAATARGRKAKGSDAPSARKPQLIDTLRAYVRAKGSQLLAQDANLTSVGIGYKQTGGVRTKQLAIQFTVNSKVAPESIEALDSKPIPATIEVGGVQVPTDIIERRFKPSFTEVTLAARDQRKVRADVVRPGMSVGNTFTRGGTVGAFVRDRTTSEIVLLSNWHVLHGASGQIGVDVVQPGRHDDNRVAQNRIGKLLRSHLGAAGDCAIASIVGRRFAGDILELGVAVSALGDPSLDDIVIKSGRTTAVTRGKVLRVEVNTPMTYEGGVTATIGGFEIGIDSGAPPPDGEITRGGDSGAVWMALGPNNKPTGVMLGLHFAGDADGTADEVALACYAESVMTALDIEPAGALAPQAIATADERGASSLGFDRGFLGFTVDAPQFRKGRDLDLAALDGDKEIRYCHFSVWLSKHRKYPLCVAWNIDGASFKHLKRKTFRADRRGDLERHQLSDAIYLRNPLDKGHIARRADLCWGNIEEARQANHDSFFFTNIVPQHEAFNQSDNRDDDPEGGVWGRLENTLFDSESPHRLRLSLMAGPVFGSGDRKFVQNEEECLLPDEFWKVVAYTDDKDGRELAFGFLLTQRHLVEPLAVPEGLDLQSWLWARITLRDLQNRTGVRFPKALLDRESPFVLPESIQGSAQAVRLLSPGDYFAR